MPNVELVLLVAIALVLGVRHGLHDGRTGRSPMPPLGRFLTATVVPLLASLALVCLYRYLTLHTLRPASAIVAAAVTVWLPFVVMRALTNLVVTRAATRSA